jgi:glutathione S-transferase
MSSLTLYYHPLSQPSRAVLALLHIGGIKYEGKIIDLLKGEQHSAEFKAINPFGTVPCLVHDRLILGESNAILSYLCDAFPAELKDFKGETIH